MSEYLHVPCCFYLVCLWLAVPSVAGAAAVLAVDFGRNDSLAAGVAGASGTLQETGFQGFYLSGAATFNGLAGLTYPGTDPLLTGGSVTVNLQGDSSGAAGNMGGRNRGNPLDSGAFTYGNMLSDGIARTKLTSVQGEFTLQLLGLAPNTPFHMRLWSASSGSDIDTTYSWYDTTLGSTLLGTIFNGPGGTLAATANTDFSVSGIVTSSNDGTLTFGVTSSNASPTSGFISGFEFNTVPEPSSSLLAGLATGLGLTRRRRR